MLQLAYMSLAADRSTEHDTAAIAYQAQLNNINDEITGILLGDGKRFLQVLEGPKESVENTFLRIMTDERHHSVMLLSRRFVTAREFGPWDMTTCETEADRTATISRVRKLVSTASEHIRGAFDVAFPCSD